MSQLSEGFRHHDLTGWTWLGQSICRLTIRGFLVSIRKHGDAFSIYGIGVVYSGCLSEMIELADKFAGKNGGWAPAPIGYEPSVWQPIETAPNDGRFVLVCQWGGEPWVYEHQQWQAPLTASYRGFHPNAPGKKLWRDKSGHPVYPTHWMPLPRPPQEGQG